MQLLLAHGAPVKVKNNKGWSPLAEAVSYGDRPTISSLVRKLKQQARDQMEERRPNLVKALNQIGDFYMELKWDFQSWGKSCLQHDFIRICIIAYRSFHKCLTGLSIMFSHTNQHLIEISFGEDILKH